MKNQNKGKKKWNKMIQLKLLIKNSTKNPDISQEKLNIPLKKNWSDSSAEFLKRKIKMI